MAKQARALATRRAVVEAAASVFVRKGYAAASIADIAEEAGVTKGALYFHFASKELLAAAVMEVQQEANRDLQERLAGGDLAAVAVLVSMVHELGVLMRENVAVRAAMRLAVVAGESGDSTISRTYDDWTEPTTAIIREAIAQGDLRSTLDPFALARLLVASFTGIQTVSLVTSELDDLMPRLRDLWVVLLPGIVAPGREQIIPDLLQRA
ncbi:ScbR family autoregulator-binding transcription factor [Salana multivorans]